MSLILMAFHSLIHIKHYSFIVICGHPYEIRKWQINYLPRDDLSTSNGIIVTKALRWPLMIDPQEQVKFKIKRLNYCTSKIFRFSTNHRRTGGLEAWNQKII